jgi:SPP1 gp7 family putative phage head morphogenesis protein
MANAEYWRDREAKQRETYIRTEDEELAEINRIYNDMYRWAEREINAFYGKYADAEGIDITEAKKRVSKLDIEEYERLAKEYVKDKDFSDRANAEMRLYNATMKINRLELLKAMIGLKLVDGTNDIDKHWEKIATDRATQEIIRQSGILGNTLTETETAKTAKQIVNADFYNANFSERIWMHMDNLKSDLSIELQKGLIAGVSSQEMARRIRKNAFEKSQKDAERLVRTELRRIQTDVARDSYERNGFDEYELMAVNPRACPICKDLDGNIYKVKDMKPGENAPPIHPNCHCTTAPHFSDSDSVERLNYFSQGGTAEGWNKMNSSERKKYYNNGVATEASSYEMWLSWLESGGTTVEWNRMSERQRRAWYKRNYG